jgi:hypothetical protein
MTAKKRINMPAVEIAWRLSRMYWGKGLATEGARGAIRYAFVTLQLRELVAITVPTNLRSRRVMDKIGMKHVPELGGHGVAILSCCSTRRTSQLYKDPRAGFLTSTYSDLLFRAEFFFDPVNGCLNGVRSAWLMVLLSWSFHGGWTRSANLMAQIVFL